MQGAVLVGDYKTYDKLVNTLIQDATEALPLEILQKIAAETDSSHFSLTKSETIKQSCYFSTPFRFDSFSPKGTYMLLEKGLDELQIVKCASNTFRDCAWSPSEEVLALSISTWYIRELRLKVCWIHKNKEDNIHIKFNKLHGAQDHTLRWFNDSELYCGTIHGTLFIHDIHEKTTKAIDRKFECGSIAKYSSKEHYAIAGRDYHSIRGIGICIYKKNKAFFNRTSYYVNDCLYHPDGRHVIAGDRGGIIYIRNIETEKRKRINSHKKNGEVICIACSPQGKITIGYKNGRIVFLEMKKDKSRIFYESENTIKDMVWKDKNTLLIGYANNKWSIWKYNDFYYSSDPLTKAVRYYKRKKRSQKEPAPSLVDLKQLYMNENGELDYKKVKYLLPYMNYRSDTDPITQECKRFLEKNNKTDH